MEFREEGKLIGLNLFTLTRFAIILEIFYERKK